MKICVLPSGGTNTKYLWLVVFTFKRYEGIQNTYNTHSTEIQMRSVGDPYSITITCIRQKNIDKEGKLPKKMPNKNEMRKILFVCSVCLFTLYA